MEWKHLKKIIAEKWAKKTENPDAGAAKIPQQTQQSLQWAATRSSPHVVLDVFAPATPTTAKQPIQPGAINKQPKKK